MMFRETLCMKLGHSRDVQRGEEMAGSYSCGMWSLVPYGKVILVLALVQTIQ